MDSPEKVHEKLAVTVAMVPLGTCTVHTRFLNLNLRDKGRKNGTQDTWVG